MRTNPLFTLLLLSSSLTGAAGCKWTDFDDLEDSTWVRSLDEPDIGATDFAVAIAGVSTGASGGTLAVLSDEVSTYSMVSFSSSGEATYASTPAPLKLTTQQIGALPEAPAFATDGTGRIGLAERSVNGASFAVLLGSSTAPGAIEIASAITPTPQPDAALFTATDFVFSAGDRIYTVPATGGTGMACTATDAGGMPISVAAMAADATNLWVWTRAGALVSYPLSSFPCTGGSLPAPTAATFTATGFMPTAGSRIHVVGNIAILAGYPATSRTGQVFVVDTTTGAQVGTTLTVEGLRSSLVADFEGTRYLVLGAPDRTVEGVAAGEVDIYELPASGMLDTTPVASLHDAQPEGSQLFGRTLTTMSFNGSTILVVGANQEIFAYYRTALYDHLP